MRPRQQRTLARAGNISGIGLHSGAAVTLTLRPAPCDHGIKFRRNDFEIDAHVSNVRNTQRQTALGNGHGTVHTVEHVLSALYGMSIDNALVKLTANEAPICDGSALPFVRLVEQCGVLEQEDSVRTFKLQRPTRMETAAGSILIVLPYDGLRISCTFVDREGSLTQYHDEIITPSTYANAIAPARTFVAFEDVEGLRKTGLIKGGIEGENAIVIRDGKLPASCPPLFPNELARHKMLDLVGDLALLGVRLEAHVIAIQPGHGPNALLTRELARLNEGGRVKSAL